MSYQIKRLLPRHEKIMDLLMEGLSQKEVAQRLMLSPRCVSYVVNSKVFQEVLAERRWAMEQEQNAEYLRQALGSQRH
jgi:DNA-binding NarL/FixJ family response regulator